MGYATTTTGYVTDVTKTKDRRTLKSEYINGSYVNIFQDVDTTVERFVGLSSSDANTVCTRSSTSTLDNVTRQYLGGIRVTVGSGTARTWLQIFGCWGTEVTSQKVRDAESNLYSVTVTTRDYTISVPGFTPTYF